MEPTTTDRDRSYELGVEIAADDTLSLEEGYELARERFPRVCEYKQAFRDGFVDALDGEVGRAR